nr:hypothetical protein [Tanacetum cinerariifolium]
MAFISSAKNNIGNGEVNTACIPIASTQVSHVGPNVATASISLDTACAYIASQSNGSQIKYEDINQIDEDDIEEMDIKWNMALLSMRVTNTRRRQGKRSSGLPEAKTGEGETTTDKGLRMGLEIMANEEENHALVADEEALTEFALMAKTSVETSKDLDNLLESQRSDKNKEGLGYSAVPPPAQVYSPPKKDMSWTGLPEFADDTITDYSRPLPAIESTSDDLQNKNPSVTETGASDSTILSKPAIKKFPTGNTKYSTADLDNKGKAVKASACWIWKPRQNTTNEGPNSNCVSVMFKKYTYIDT